jgi:hypothetical protein
MKQTIYIMTLAIFSSLTIYLSYPEEFSWSKSIVIEAIGNQEELTSKVKSTEQTANDILYSSIDQLTTQQNYQIQQTLLDDNFYITDITLFERNETIKKLTKETTDYPKVELILTNDEAYSKYEGDYYYAEKDKISDEIESNTYNFNYALLKELNAIDQTELIGEVTLFDNQNYYVLVVAERSIMLVNTENKNIAFVLIYNKDSNLFNIQSVRYEKIEIELPKEEEVKEATATNLYEI